jgi:3-oxoacyl-[acyl-carrier protein] reductase
MNLLRRAQAAAEEVAHRIAGLGGEAIVVQANCGKPAEVEALVKAATDQFGALDVLVNNAGITRDTLMMRMKPEQWQEVIDVNLSGVFYATQVRGLKRFFYYYSFSPSLFADRFPAELACFL